MLQPNILRKVITQQPFITLGAEFFETTHQRKCRETRNFLNCFDIINDNVEHAWTAVQSSMELLQTQHLVTATLLIVRLALASNPSWLCVMKPISILAPHPHIHIKYRYLTLVTGFISQTSVPLTPIYNSLTLAKVLMLNEKAD